MKLYKYMAIAALAAAFGACTADDHDLSDGTEASVTVTLTAPESLTRAAGEAATVDMLKYGVYDLTDGSRTLVEEGEVSPTGFPYSLDLQLMTGHKYGLLFWAGSATALYGDNDNDLGVAYTIDMEEGTLAVNYDNTVANSEYLDGFYSYSMLTVDGNTGISVTLKRPFAMVCIGANKAPAEGSQSSVTVSAAGSGLDLFSGEVLNKTSEAVFAEAPVPTGETYPVSGYDYVAYVYVLPSVVPTDITYTCAGSSKTATGVFLQANYRTNIYGSLPSEN